MQRRGEPRARPRSPRAGLRFAALQSDAGRALLRRAGRAPDDISSIVLVEERDALGKSDAVLRIATYLENPLLPAAGTLGVLVPGFARDAVYDLVANNRYDILGMKGRVQARRRPIRRPICRRPISTSRLV